MILPHFTWASQSSKGFARGSLSVLQSGLKWLLLRVYRFISAYIVLFVLTSALILRRFEFVYCGEHSCGLNFLLANCSSEFACRFRILLSNFLLRSVAFSYFHRPTWAGRLFSFCDFRALEKCVFWVFSEG